jgi:Sec-independent protein secretion pathway component TatC
LKILSVLVAALILFALGIAFVTWLTMLAFGISHGIDDQIPAIGFWASVPFGVLLAIVGGSSASGTAK